MDNDCEYNHDSYAVTFCVTKLGNHSIKISYDDWNGLVQVLGVSPDEDDSVEWQSKSQYFKKGRIILSSNLV